MPEEQTTIVSVNTEEITVIIDNNLPNLSPIANIINKLISNYDKFDMISNNVISNSSLYLNLNEIQDLKALKPLTANWQETYEEMNLIQPLSSNWQETFIEVNTIQNTLSSDWQKSFEYINNGITIDGGLF